MFTQFASDLDDATRRQLAYGQGLMYLLRQPQFHPIPREEQVVILVAAMHRVMQEIPPEQILAFRTQLLAFFAENEGALLSSIRSTGTLSDADRARIEQRADEFARQYAARGESV